MYSIKIFQSSECKALRIVYILHFKEPVFDVFLMCLAMRFCSMGEILSSLL